MTKRKKRLEKGIESIKEQIKFHEGKLAKAREDKNEILQRYYEKEIETMKRVLQRREDIHKKQ